MNYDTIVLAAGKGSRSKLPYNKILHKVNNQTILQQALQVFLEDTDCKNLIVAVSKEDYKEIDQLLRGSNVQLVMGGATRQESVMNALKLVVSEVVMVHDGARPYITNKEVEDLKQQFPKEQACILMVPVTDTIKQIENGYVVHTPNREDYFAAQTPQAFDTTLLKDCYKKAKQQGIVASDDSMLVEQCSNVAIKVVLGSYANKKITTSEDVEIKKP